MPASPAFDCKKPVVRRHEYENELSHADVVVGRLRNEAAVLQVTQQQ